MTKNEFIEGLRTALAGEIPDAEITSNIHFYEDYIKSKSTNSREEEIVSQLGEPRLIAKTIIDTYQISHGPIYNRSKHEGAYQEAQTSDGSSYRDYKDQSDKKNGNYGRKLKFNMNLPITWYQKLFVIIVVVIFIVLFFIIGGILLRLFFTVGLPLMILYLAYKLIISNFKR